jgi:hypothetical protein
MWATCFDPQRGHHQASTITNLKILVHKQLGVPTGSRTVYMRYKRCLVEYKIRLTLMVKLKPH